MYIMLNYNITRAFDTAAVAVEYCWHPPAINCEPRQLTVTSPGGLDCRAPGGTLRLEPGSGPDAGRVGRNGEESSLDLCQLCQTDGSHAGREQRILKVCLCKVIAMQSG